MSLTLEGEYQWEHWYKTCGWYVTYSGGRISTGTLIHALWLMSLTLEGEYQWGHWHKTCGWYVTHSGGRISTGTLIHDLWLICNLPWRENINGDIDTRLVVDMSLTLEGEYQRGHWYMTCGWCHLPWRENISGDIDTRLVVDMSLTLEGEYQWGHWYMTCGWNVTHPGHWYKTCGWYVTYSGGRISMGTLIHDLWLICHLPWRENINGDIDTWLVVDMSLTLEGEYQWGHWYMTCGWYVTYSGGRISMGTLIHDLWLICHLLWRENINGDIDTWLVVDMSLTLEGEYQ